LVSVSAQQSDFVRLTPVSQNFVRAQLSSIHCSAKCRAVRKTSESSAHSSAVSRSTRRLLGRLSRWLTLETHYRRILEAEMRGRLKAKNVIEREN